LESSVLLGDCLTILQTLNDNSIDVIYLDPPFFSQKNYAMNTSEGKKYVFSDKWENPSAYKDFMKNRIKECYRVLKDTGSIFLHCDTSASHFLRSILDEIFSPNNFLNEIIWTYKRWSNSKKGLLSCHQTIFFYTKSKNYTFNKLLGEYSPTTNLDQILQERTRNEVNKSSYKKDENGNVVNTTQKKGVPLSDVWNIPFLNPKAKERTGYPTQKPLELLERIIKISSNEGDIILDPFCGSGTSLVAAKILNRNFIGIDNSKEAVTITQNRLNNPIKSESQLLKKGFSSFMTLSPEKMDILRQFNAKPVYRNKGLDGLINDFENDRIIALKIQDSDEDLYESAQKLDYAKNKRNLDLGILLQTHSDIQLLGISDKNIFPGIKIIKSYKFFLNQLILDNFDDTNKFSL